jgi:hypothetical protein
MLLSSLKSLVETGEPLEFRAQNAKFWTGGLSTA